MLEPVGPPHRRPAPEPAAWSLLARTPEATDRSGRRAQFLVRSGAEISLSAPLQVCSVALTPELTCGRSAYGDDSANLKMKSTGGYYDAFSARQVQHFVRAPFRALGPAPEKVLSERAPAPDDWCTDALAITARGATPDASVIDPARVVPGVARRATILRATPQRVSRSR